MKNVFATAHLGLTLLLALPVGPLRAQVVAVAGPAQARPAEYLHPRLEQDPYYQRKLGFRTITEARNHAHKAFKQGVQAGSILPANREYFSYIYQAERADGQRGRYLHSPWVPAEFLRIAQGNEMYCVQPPFPDGEGLVKISMIHSHPTSNPNGLGPSRMDVALASSYRKPDGRFRYLYLINNRQQLIRYKALRRIDPADPSAVQRLPVKPLEGRDWLR